MEKENRTALVWFRNDLRIRDQHSLYAALNSYSKVVAYYSFDPRHYKKTPWGFTKTGSHRAQFLIETLAELQYALQQLNITLIIDRKMPEEGLLYWIEKLGVGALYFQKEWTQEEFDIENKLKESLSNQITFYSCYDQFLFHPEELPFQIENLPEVFTQFRKQCEKQSHVRPLLPTLSPLAKDNLLEQQFHLPSLSDLGLAEKTPHPNSAFPFKGGHLQGLERLKHYFWKTQKLSFYKQTRNGLVGIDYSSKLSAWLANGALSAREIYWEIRAYEKEIKKNESTYWLIFELIWRDYFKFFALKHKNSIFQLGGILKQNYHWKNEVREIENWINGNTAEPFVNANMIELKKTGWMSNRGRQNVASYFAKECYLDWRIGAAYFESQLIDYDVHSNYGNWMYVAGVGNDPRDRKFNIKLQAERYDQAGKFQRLWNQNTLFE